MTEFRPGRFQVLPPVVKNIIIINVLVVLIQYVLGQHGIDLADYGGLHYWKSQYFAWQIFTHMFMHGSYNDPEGTLFHIGFNMFALWMFGRILENVWGPKRFLFFYLVCGIGAALCYLTVLGFEYGALEKAFHVYELNPTLDQFNLFLIQHVQPDPSNPLYNTLSQIQLNWSQAPSAIHYSYESIPAIHSYLYGATDLATHVHWDGIFDEATIGASGAVFGVLFAFGYLFPNTPLYIFFVPIPVKAKYVVGAYALFELFSGIRNAPGDHVAHFAHIGGMIFAFILLRIWNKTNRKQFY